MVSEFDGLEIRASIDMAYFWSKRVDYAQIGTSVILTDAGMDKQMADKAAYIVVATVLKIILLPHIPVDEPAWDILWTWLNQEYDIELPSQYGALPRAIMDHDDPIMQIEDHVEYSKISPVELKITMFSVEDIVSDFMTEYAARVLPLLDEQTDVQTREDLREFMLQELGKILPDKRIAPGTRHIHLDYIIQDVLDTDRVECQDLLGDIWILCLDHVNCTTGHGGPFCSGCMSPCHLNSMV